MQGKKTPDMLCFAVVRMHALEVTMGQIIAYTGLSERNIRKIIKRFQLTGEAGLPKVPTRDPLLRTSRSSLTAENIHVSVGKFSSNRPLTLSQKFIEKSIERRPDIYLREIINDLQDICETGTTISSVWRALRSSGYSRKKVGIRFI